MRCLVASKSLSPEQARMVTQRVPFGEGCVNRIDRMLFDRAMPNPASSRFHEFYDHGTSNSIMLVESADSEIHLLEPRHIPFGKAMKRRNAATAQCLARRYDETGILLADGETRSLKESVDHGILAGLLRVGPTGDDAQQAECSNLLRSDTRMRQQFDSPGRRCSFKRRSELDYR